MSIKMYLPYFYSLTIHLIIIKKFNFMVWHLHLIISKEGNLSRITKLAYFMVWHLHLIISKEGNLSRIT